METTYLVCAAIGGTLIVCQFVLALFGLGGHHDISGGEHVEIDSHVGVGDHDSSEHHDDSAWFMGMLTFRTVSAALAFFGLAGIIGERENLDSAVTVVLAAIAGIAALFMVSWIMKLLVRFNVDGTVRIDKAVGCAGTVYISIPASNAGQGKVQVCVLNRTMEYKAVTPNRALTPGVKIVVVRVVAPDTVEVSSTLE